MKKISLLLFAAILLTACQPAATPQPVVDQPTAIPPTAIPPTTIPPTPTTDPIVQQLAGKYLTTITIEESKSGPGIDPGEYLLKLQPDMRWFVVDFKDGFVYVQGYFAVTVDQIVFETKGGPTAGACIGSFGTYTWSLEGGVLTLTVIRDDCPGGKFFFTIHPFVLQP